MFAPAVRRRKREPNLPQFPRIRGRESGTRA
jgi:hypothetical protein